MSELKKALIVSLATAICLKSRSADGALMFKPLRFFYAFLKKMAKCIVKEEKRGANPPLRPNHDICGFVMPGFFCRLFLFRHLWLSRFMDMFFHFLDLSRKAFKDLTGNFEMLFYQS